MSVEEGYPNIIRLTIELVAKVTGKQIPDQAHTTKMSFIPFSYIPWLIGVTRTFHLDFLALASWWEVTGENILW